ncbi:hypothetical protein R1sor_004916 [Riccia sorocarpa]|uniref:Uncharacterized protein n=1 Tax=Riccia sorocarpa TaxID=122646 RepID=A0ABD3HME9_9MARC
MVDKLKSLSGESVEYESRILTRFLKHSSISKTLKNHVIHTLDITHTEFYEQFMLHHISYQDKLAHFVKHDFIQKWQAK